MRVEQFVDEGLGNTAHLVAADGSREAAIVDPLRDVDVYLVAADALGLRITHVFETHMHNDFISGARELAARTGAQVCSSADGGLAYPHRPLRAGDRVHIGGLEIAVLGTPGHTPEHVAYLAADSTAPGTPAALFSGGSLLVGAVSRTDLLGEEQAPAFARALYRSLHEQLLPLPDSTRVYPTHGAGSFCTAAPGAARRTTIGAERHSNPLLQIDDPGAFVVAALEGLPSYPAYFAHMREINRQGPPLLGTLPTLPPLSPREVRSRMAHGAIVVDARPVAQYAAGHIPNAFSVELRSAFGSWVGWVVPFGTPIIVVAEARDGPDSPDGNDGLDGRRAYEAIVRQLVRIGYDQLLGYLEGGLAAWREAGHPVRTLDTVTVQQVNEAVSGRSTAATDPTRPLVVLDVRQDAEWQGGHIPGARHVEAGALAHRASQLPAGATIAVHCGHEQRAATALSVLERHGFRELRLVEGGWDAWEEAELPVVRPDGGAADRAVPALGPGGRFGTAPGAPA